MISYNEITQKKQLSFQEIDLDKAAIYSGEDVFITKRLYDQQRENTYLKDNTVLYNIELPLMQVLSDMEMRGIKIDRDLLK
jgi:DNA polymerase-1